VASFLSRYLAGEHEGVWNELVLLGPQVRDEPLLSDAAAVARETMRRAKENLLAVIDRLVDIGYRFEEQAPREEGVTIAEVYVPPGPDMGERISELEAVAGVLPLSLRASYEIVGRVNLMGTIQRGMAVPIRIRWSLKT
jgi:hypothetical protein